MTLTIIGDFADPLSFLASQRAEHIRSLGLHEVRWLAVETDRSRPMGGRPLDVADLDETRRLALPGEALPVAGVQVPNSRAATAAYAESLTDGVPDAMRCALFDALWVSGRNIGDPDVIRSIAFGVLNPSPPHDDMQWRIRTNLPIVPLGDPDPIRTTRRLGFIVSTGRGPLTVSGQERLDEWRRFWQQHGAVGLPLLLTDDDEAFRGPDALTWLTRQLAHRDSATTPCPHRRRRHQGASASPTGGLLHFLSQTEPSKGDPCPSTTNFLTSARRSRPGATN